MLPSATTAPAGTAVNEPARVMGDAPPNVKVAPATSKPVKDTLMALPALLLSAAVPDTAGAPPMVMLGVPPTTLMVPAIEPPPFALNEVELIASNDEAPSVSAPETVSEPVVVRVTVVVAEPILSDGKVTALPTVARVTAESPVAKLAAVKVPPPSVNVPAPNVKTAPAVPVRVLNEPPPFMLRAVVADPRLIVPVEFTKPDTLKVPVRVDAPLCVKVVPTCRVLRRPKARVAEPLIVKERALHDTGAPVGAVTVLPFGIVTSAKIVGIPLDHTARLSQAPDAIALVANAVINV